MKWYWAAILSFVLAATVFGTMYWYHPREVEVPVPSEPVVYVDSTYIHKCQTLTEDKIKLNKELKRWVADKTQLEAALEQARTELDTAYAWFYAMMEAIGADTVYVDHTATQLTKLGTLRSKVVARSYGPIDVVKHEVSLDEGIDKMFNQVYQEGVVEGKKKQNWLRTSRDVLIGIILRQAVDSFVDKK